MMKSQYYCPILISILLEFTALLREKRNSEDANSDVSNLSSTSSLSISTLSTDQSKTRVTACMHKDTWENLKGQTPDITQVTHASFSTPSTSGRPPAVFKVIFLLIVTLCVITYIPL